MPERENDRERALRVSKKIASRAAALAVGGRLARFRVY